MPGQRAITLRVRKPQHIQTQQHDQLIDDLSEPSALHSGSSLTDLDANTTDAPEEHAGSLQGPADDQDGDGDVAMTASDDPVGLESQAPPANSSRPRRARIARTRSVEQKAEAPVEAHTSPRASRRRRQSSMQAPKEENVEENEGAMLTEARQEQHPDPVDTDQTDLKAAPSDQENDPDEGDQEERPEDATDSPSKGRGSARGRMKGRGRARGRVRGRATVGRGRTKVVSSRARGKSKHNAASDDGGGASDPEGRGLDAEAGAGEGEDGEEEAEAEGGEEGDGPEDEDDNAEDNDLGDGNEGTGIDAEGFKTITVKGQVYRLDGDEVVLEDDPDGDKKIDAKGRLQGGRQYKGYNFTSELRDDPDRIYMLSIDAARSAGYRDSLYFFRRNPQIIKITLHQGEKDKLIEDGRLSGQLKSRNVTMVAARNVYKLHGAKFLSGGKAVVDDYYEAAARASGAKEGKTVGGLSLEEQERKKEADRDRDRTRKRPDAYTFTTYDPQGEAVVTVFGDGGQTPFVRAGNWVSRKAFLQRSDISEQNWMLEMARSVRGMNSELADTRRDRLVAFRRFEESLHARTASGEAEDGEAEPEEDEGAEHDRPPWEREELQEGQDSAHKRQAAEALLQKAKKRKGPPIGIYEPNTHMPHFAISTQPTWARIEKISPRPHFVRDAARDAGSSRPLLGGDRMGSGAWGLASFSTEVVPPPEPEAFRKIASGVDMGPEALRG